MTKTSLFSDLQYVPASMLRGGGVDFGRLPVETDQRRPVGRLAGVLVDPTVKKLRYLVVDGSRWLAGAWRVVPFSVAVIDAASGILRVDGGAVDECVELEPSAIIGTTRAAS
jgi:hypothetical protein